MDSTERVSRYLSGQMEEQERLSFEAEAAADPSLAEELSLQRAMAILLNNKDKREARLAQLQALGTAYFQADTAAKPKSRLRALWPLGMAAAAAIALLLVWPFLFGPSLYESYAQHPQLALAEKSATAVDVAQAEAAFNRGDYAAAAPLLRAYNAQQPQDQLGLLYLGIAELELDQFDAARQRFLSLSDAAPDIRDYAEWYLALSYLKSGDKEECRARLQAIPDRSAFAEQAEALLGKL